MRPHPDKGERHGGHPSPPLDRRSTRARPGAGRHARRIERWWTGHTLAPDAGTLRFSFGGPDAAAAVEITEETPEQIVWRVVEGPPDWIGTDIIFTLRPTGEGTTLLFSHAGWRETGEFMANCSSEWASYLIGLKAGAEGGSFTPYPAGQVSRWSRPEHRHKERN